MKFLKAVADRIYIVRCTNNDTQLALSFRGALSAMKQAGQDASVQTVAGRWIAGRRRGVGPMRTHTIAPAAWPIPADRARAVREALRAVDVDIERTGTVSAETVDKVRIVRAQLDDAPMCGHVIGYRQAEAARYLAAANKPGLPDTVRTTLVNNAHAELLLAAGEPR